MKKLCLSAVFLLCSAQLLAQEISLEQAMAHPDWLGRQPQQPYWSDDSESVYFQRKRESTEQTDLYRISIDGENLRQLFAEDFSAIDVAGDIVSPDGRLKAYAREGDIYVKNLRNGEISQLTRTAVNESNPLFSADSNKVIFERDDLIFVRDLYSGLESQAADLRFENPPREEEQNYLDEQQLRLFDIIELAREREELEQEYIEENRELDSSRLALPYYLGEDSELLNAALSPNENWMLISIRDKTERTPGRAGSMPAYVTASGYVENREVRSRVGTTDFAPQRLYLISLSEHKIAGIDLSGLPGITEIPLRDQLGDDYPEPTVEEDIRELYFIDLDWSDDGSKVAFQAISRDNKDRWVLNLNTNGLSLSDREDDESSTEISDLTVPIDLDSGHMQLALHNHDPAWINRRMFFAGEWLPDNESYFFLSELDGYQHIYVFDGNNTQQITRGKFEVLEPQLTRDSEQVYFRGNLGHPTIYEIFRVDLGDGEIEQLSSLGGMNEFQLSPDEDKLLIIHSEAIKPPELYVAQTRPNANVTQLTDTISDAFKSIDWAQPEYVEVPSAHVSNPIHSRVYTPDNNETNRPAVIFIHGAGYLQNAHQGWSGYFREFMFHSFLVQQGYVVLDMDYRASEGYGRDWRTAIYQQMGTPEVEDLADGIDWLVANKRVDRDRVCAYGGSYGGFLTLMAMFQHPELFACGAALRPVTDWAHYNHGYTSNILNIPAIDPAAFERSSPIEFAEGLEKPLLIAHGMLDDNVFFQDSVRLVQRLIELKKENWELAVYPIEPHGFREPSSWLDEYRRIYKLVEETLKN
ncbi:MAG: prolyl oligopeptidase family serine peptidase [Gammaproteobacteria bacterium]|nr:prolyl oligopeptidase family serine peptidase [Gammaproteobacteria bacterium]MDD9895784.1 prolyl oligopeptidase family serine peptidase [Gammaproteobacteria bacterium]MDD9959915.1 prolyl oligopeptidase family serine peptidase [Gammaproteobacteria bacterium]